MRGSRVLEHLRFATPNATTASIGVAERLPGESASDLLARAAASLYEARDSGRDRLHAAV